MHSIAGCPELALDVPMASIDSSLLRAVSRVLDAFSQRPPTTKEDDVACYANGGDGAFSSAAMAALGEAVAESLGCANKLKILDVGCGARTSAGCVASLLARETAEYTCIDRDAVEPSAAAKIALERACAPNRIRELRGDVFEMDLDGHLELNHFDVVIIDIEPHGREAEVYERVLRHLADTHVVVLKHVAFIDVIGSAFADRFLDRHFTERRVMDYYAVRVLNGWEMRDVYVVMTREAGRGAREEGRTQELFCAKVKSAGVRIDTWSCGDDVRAYVANVCTFGEVTRVFS